MQLQSQVQLVFLFSVLVPKRKSTLVSMNIRLTIGGSLERLASCGTWEDELT